MSKLVVDRPDKQELTRLNKLRLDISKLPPKDIPIKEYMLLCSRCRLLQDEIRKADLSGQKNVAETGKPGSAPGVGKANPLGVGVGV